VVSALAEQAAEPRGDLPRAEHLDTAVAKLAAGYDAERGGFGGAPKFPPSMVLEFLLRHYERTGDPRALAMVDGTAEAMARGGLYDQLAGGFARYSVDADWVVPHFEKMLYDNALLLGVYVHWWRLTGSPLAERIARETADFLLLELRTPEGGFASALDADTEGVEGLTYVWTPEQLREVLGERVTEAMALFEVTEAGTFEEGASTLQLLSDPNDVDAWLQLRERLLIARAERPQPGRDDKVVTSWNGLAMAALAEAGVVLAEPRYLAAAVACAELMTSVHLVGGRLRRSSRDGQIGVPVGVAEDYGNLATGLLAVYQATAEARWLTDAGVILDAARAHFGDGDGGFFDTADDAEQLVRRPRDPGDNATPSGQSSVAQALLTYSALTGSLDHRVAAESGLSVVTWLGVAQPRFVGWALAAAEALIDGPREIAIVGEAGGGPLTELAWRRRPAGGVVVNGTPDADGSPLLAGRPLLAGAAAAYVCRGLVCDRPVTSLEELAALLA
jgi:uncharacterized protein YyaL (SSP411 family)